jgi:hypothetical protein
MYTQFRQGILQYSPPDLIYINGNSADLIVDDWPVIVTFSAGTKNYLWIEKQPVINAWHPILPSQTQWLFWDIDMRTGARTFGYTLIQPVVSAVPPVSPVTDLHWLDTTANIIKVWSGNSWRQRIRVFACKVINGAVIQSMGADAPLFTGSQMGVSGTTTSGYIVYDNITNKPIIASDGTFITTEDQLHVQSVADANIKLSSTAITAEAQQNLAAYTIVKFIDFNKIVHADRFAGQQYKRFGIIQQNAVIGDIIQVDTEGLIINLSWDWTSAGVNAELYSDDSGVLSTVPIGTDPYPVATVVDRHTIQLGTPHITSTNVIGPTSGTVLTDGSVPMTGDLETPGINLDNSSITSTHTITSSVTPAQIATFDITTRKVCKYLVSVIDSFGNVHAEEVLVTVQGPATYICEYGVVTTNTTLGTFDADVVGSNCLLNFIPASSTPMSITVTSINQ